VGNMKPDCLQIASGAATAVLAVVLTIVLWAMWGAGLAVALLLLSPIWIINVSLGGGFNEPPLDAFGRLRRFRADPQAFFHK
jgi:hypothetical protein